ncbi:alpha/beta fold hydrolase [Qipengyuania nanhaisediminis]|uniref:Pimeloyl-ACP methyl ester carboxylesterase n=1 Tax=Qipengyuania nanhaisediminis TaxID=604088 RepID=A0A1I5PPX5_9SPHN|nr:alpha/beta hydrolase [Qipengyuania nanhaisediminis]SFP35947.1 Pimeloyl-ACP methyl ester carboxylesterase [Qipengyuania nanhaisediminis]
MSTEYSERSWQSAEGLTLYFRDYGEANDRPPVLCLHGLTRNSKDFEGVAAHIAEQGWRVIVPDMRGRGKSDYAEDSATYAVPNYIGDVLALLEQEGIEKFVSIGTSMGGLMTMLIAQAMPHRIAAALLNDIGPVVDPAGIDKIRTYLGQGRSFPTWMHAARALEEVHGESHPSFDTEDWIAMAKRGMTVCSNGRIAFDYDMKIADPFNDADENAVPPDLWPGFEALASNPLLLVRGGLSALLSADAFAEMQKRAPNADVVVVEDAGHAPTLDEPEVRTAIDSLLASVK